MMAPVSKVLSAGGALQETAGIEVVGAGPRLGNDAGSLLRDLVVRGVSAGISRSAAPSGAAPAPGSSSAGGSRMSGPCLSGSPGFPPSSINWRRVRDEAAFTCL
jgi:hypothetical protein